MKNSFDKDIDDLADEWRIYSQPNLLKSIVRECYFLIGKNWVKYDYLLALGNNATPFAYSLGLFFNKKVLFVDDEWGVTSFFQAIKPTNVDLNNKRLLVVIPYFESGLKASRGIDVINKKAKNLHIDVLTIVFFPEYIDKEIFRKNKYKNSMLYYLFSWDEKIKKQILKN